MGVIEASFRAGYKLIMLDLLLARLGTLFRKDSSQSKWSFYLGLSIIAGLITVVLRLGQSGKNSADEIGAGLLLSGASLFLGLLVGFVFAIPKSSRNSRDEGVASQSPKKTEGSYILNSNLEEISDWLTKMLVGVGLIQLKDTPGYIKKVSIYWAQSIGGNSQAAFVSAQVVFFLIGGFLLGYLWTRLALIQDFIDQDPRRLIDGLSKIAQSEVAPVELREEATRQIAEVVKSPNSSLAERTAASAELVTISSSSYPVGIRSIAREGLELVSRFEGDALKPFPDAMGIMAIGYGHTLSEAEKSKGYISIGGRKVDYKKGLTSQEAMDLLDQDLEPVRQAVDDMVEVPINRNQRDALVSFAYNVGIDILKESNLLRELNSSNYDAVPNELMKWCRVGDTELPGLLARRREEAELWCKPI